MNGVFKYLIFTSRFFFLCAIIVLVMALSFVVFWLYPVSWTFGGFLGLFVIFDIFVLFNKKLNISVVRKLPSLLSLSDENTIVYTIKNNSRRKLKIECIDQLPYQLQIRDFLLSLVLNADESKEFKYIIRPVIRGEYHFGDIYLFVESPLKLIKRKIVLKRDANVPVYPSIIQMKKYELKIQERLAVFEGIKRHRRIGHSYEFEHIKEYVIGDDSRSVNWKASSRRGNLMVNHYEDERSQQVYSIIDKSRSMRMSFNNLSLLDYSINTSLVISNVVLQKHDKAGLITFSDKIGSVISAERSDNQLKKIIETLYNEKEHYLEAEYELFFQILRNVVKQRSLLFLYTNFESYHAFQRVLPVLRQISRIHLLIVVFFENEEVEETSRMEANDVKDIYIKMSAWRYQEEKRQIQTELNNHGIISIRTAPGNLSVNVINKYLELKSRGYI
jgi:uncharacterized protein (DUF58 family)